MSAVITGLGASVPPDVVTNADLERRLDTSDAWIRSRTGIAQRHVAAPGTATSDLALEAGARALKSSGSAEVQAVVLSTMTPDRTCPPTAPQVAAGLGLSGTLAFDLNGACSGFLYGLAVAAALLDARFAEQVLLIGAETMSRVVDPGDRDTAVLFGDAAGAVVVRRGTPEEAGAVGPFDLGSDGDLADLLHTPAGGSRLPADCGTAARGEHYLRMDGRQVYREAVAGMTRSCQRVLATSDLDAADVACLVAHQANARIVNAVADRLGIAADRRASNVERYGNTSAASIPLLLAETGPARLAPGDNVLLTAFGAGLTWASALLRWPALDPVCS